jgi:hypothetical protein
VTRLNVLEIREEGAGFEIGLGELQIECGLARSASFLALMI